ncbi:MAG TPA: hypothetical protein VKD91_09410 [Pyrinomonadaceae bacterium]|nr:hypothetical protein [Pyrinomonadaceae bacterium]
MITALLTLAIPVTGVAQIYQRDYRYDRSDRDVRDAVAQLSYSASNLERDLNYGRQRRILGGLLYVNTVDTNAIDQVRDFRRAVADLRRSLRGDYSMRGDYSRGDYSLDSSRDEARIVIDRGIELDRYLRLRTGSTNVDADLANMRSSLHVLAEAYGMSRRY